MIEDNFPTPGEISHLLFFSSFFFWKIAVHYVKTPSLLKKLFLFFNCKNRIFYRSHYPFYSIAVIIIELCDSVVFMYIFSH